MRILVVEDELRIQAFLARALEAEGYAVVPALDGEAALRHLRQLRFDLVVLDLLLPRVDGFAVLHALRAAPAAVPVVVLSARGDLPTKLRAFVGACDYVAKPFSLEELLARVRVHLRPAGAGERSDVLAAGPLELDLARRQARLGAVVADLSHREFRLMLELMRHPGEVLSRERLLAEVWGYHFDPGSNVVDVCIRRLRRKLGSAAPIETVRHAGYRLAPA